MLRLLPLYVELLIELNPLIDVMPVDSEYWFAFVVVIGILKEVDNALILGIVPIINVGIAGAWLIVKLLALEIHPLLFFVTRL